MKHLLFYFKRYKLESIMAPLFKMLESCFDLFVPIVVAKIIDVGIKNRDTSYVVACFGILILMALLGFGCCLVAQYFAAKAATGTATHLRHRLLEKIQSFSAEQYDKIGLSTLIIRMTSDVNQVQNGINMFLRLFLRSPFIVFGAMIMAFTVNPNLAWFFVIAIGILFLLVFGIMLITRPLFKKVQKSAEDITRETAENLNGVRVIRAFGRENTQRQRFNDKNSILYKAQKISGNVGALMNPLTYITVNTVIVALLWFGAKYVNGGIILSGSIIALINYIGQILIELVKLANLIVLLSKASVSLGRVGEILDTEPSMEFAGDFNGENLPAEVEFKNVSLRYGEAKENSLSNLSFSAKAGETVGIIGGTGSGKSSLVKLISRMYDATEGEVLIKGENIKNWDRNALSSTIATVEQKPVIFSGSVKSNLLIANQNANEEDMWKALEIAQAKDFVLKDGGLEREIEQGGANLSGGQKQRLAVARALVKGAEILILDDSFSALDYATDKKLRSALLNHSKNTVTFIVSQRASSIINAHKIIVLDDGEIAGMGGHSELLETCSVYREIYFSQNKKEDI